MKSILLSAVFTLLLPCFTSAIEFIPIEIAGHPEMMAEDGHRLVTNITDGWLVERDDQQDKTFYSQTVFVPAHWQDKRIYFWIDDAYPAVQITVNGHVFGPFIHSDHVSGSVDITRWIKFDQENDLAFTILPIDTIRMEDQSGTKKFFAPAGPREWVERTSTVEFPSLRGTTWLIGLNDVFVQKSRTEIDLANKHIQLHTTLNNLTRIRNFDIVVELFEIGVHKNPDLVFTPSSEAVSSISQSVNMAGRSEKIRFDLPFPDDYQLWRPDNPFLYMFRIQIFSDGRALDSYTDRIGLRTFGISGPDFTFNGQNFLARLVFTSCWDEHGGWNTGHIAERITRFKYEFGYNLFRTHGWPRSRYFYMLADQYGLPIICEAAVAFGRYYVVEDPDSPLWEHWKTHAGRLIDIYGNFPSIVLWSAENELLSEPRIIDRTGQIHEKLWEIDDLFKSLDPSRPVMFEGDLDIRGKADIINEHYPLRYGSSLWPTDFYWVGKPHVPGQADGRFYYGKIKWDRSKPYVFGETMWFPTGGPTRHSPFIGDRAYKYFIRYPHSRWNIGDNFNSFDMLNRAYHMQEVTAFVVQSSTDLIHHLRYKYTAIP